MNRKKAEASGNTLNNSAAGSSGKVGVSRGLVLLALGLSAVFAVYLLLHVPIGIPGEWWIEYRSILPSAGAIAAFAAAMAALVAAAAYFDAARPNRRFATAGPMACLALLYLVVLFAGGRCGPQGAAEMIAPAFKFDASGLFAREAAKIENPRRYLADFAGTLESYAADYRETVRVNNNPPGTTVLFYLARRFAEKYPNAARVACELVFGAGFVPPDATYAAAVVASWWLLAAAAFSIVPAYLAAARLAPTHGFLVAALACLSGSMALFVPGKDTLQVTVFLWMLYFTLAGRKHRPLAWGFALGLAAAVAFFFTLAAAVVVAVLAIFTAWSEVRRGRRFEALARFWLAAAAGLLLGFALFYVLFSYNSFAGLLACYRNHALFYVNFPRTYWKWLLYNPVEFAMFLGAPLTAAVAWYSGGRAQAEPGDRHTASARSLALSALVVLAVLDLTGKNASEVARLWVFFMPLVALPVLAIASDRPQGRWNIFTLAGLQILSVLLLRTLVDIWRVESLFRELQGL